jgi:hypothetical protein
MDMRFLMIQNETVDYFSHSYVKRFMLYTESDEHLACFTITEGAGTRAGAASMTNT